MKIIKGLPAVIRCEQLKRKKRLSDSQLTQAIMFCVAIMMFRDPSSDMKRFLVSGTVVGSKALHLTTSP